MYLVRSVVRNTPDNDDYLGEDELWVDLFKAKVYNRFDEAVVDGWMRLGDPREHNRWNVVVIDNDIYRNIVEYIFPGNMPR